MPRAMSSAMLAVLTSTYFKPAIFVRITFADGAQHLWSGTGTINWNGANWTGVGSFGAVSTIEEGVTVEAKGIVLALSGIDPTMLAECLQQCKLGLDATVWLGGLDADGFLLDSPIVSWRGRTDQPTFEVGVPNSTISINCESRLLDMNVAADRRYTLEDSQMDNPGDLGFMFVNGLQEQTIYWGSSPNSTNNI